MAGGTLGGRLSEPENFSKCFRRPRHAEPAARASAAKLAPSSMDKLQVPQIGVRIRRSQPARSAPAGVSPCPSSASRTNVRAPASVLGEPSSVPAVVAVRADPPFGARRPDIALACCLCCSRCSRCHWDDGCISFSPSGVERLRPPSSSSHTGRRPRPPVPAVAMEHCAAASSHLPAGATQGGGASVLVDVIVDCVFGRMSGMCPRKSTAANARRQTSRTD